MIKVKKIKEKKNKNYFWEKVFLKWERFFCEGKQSGIATLIHVGIITCAVGFFTVQFFKIWKFMYAKNIASHYWDDFVLTIYFGKYVLIWLGCLILYYFIVYRFRAYLHTRTLYLDYWLNIFARTYIYVYNRNKELFLRNVMQDAALAFFWQRSSSLIKLSEERDEVLVKPALDSVNHLFFEKFKKEIDLYYFFALSQIEERISEAEIKNEEDILNAASREYDRRLSMAILAMSAADEYADLNAKEGENKVGNSWTDSDINALLKMHRDNQKSQKNT